MNKFKIKKQSLYILLLIATIIMAALVGAIIGYSKAVIDHPIPNMDCGTLIMRQEIKGWDGYIDVPYDLNQFRNPYEENISWNLNDTEINKNV
jgi:hypothetical protein